MLITFVCLFGIKYLVDQAIDSGGEPYRSGLEAIGQEYRKSGLSLGQTLEKVIKENPDMYLEMAKEQTRTGNMVLLAGLIAAIALFYFSSVTIAYLTREART